MQTDRNIIPYNDSGIILKIPHINETKYGNIKIYKYQDNSQPLVNFKVNFKNGAATDTVPGIANFTMSMLQGGTNNNSASEISELFESLGASYFFNAYWDECAAGFSSLEQFFKPCFDLMMECIFKPSFPDKEIDRQRDKIAASIMQNNADPGYIAQIAFNAGMFKGHPYGHSRTGNLENLASVTKQQILDFYDILLLKSEVSIIITGNFDEAEVDRLLEKSFAQIQNNTNKFEFTDFIPKPSNHIIAGKEDSLQTNLRIGKMSIDRKHEDYAAFQIVNTIFGGYFLSRLNHVLRETKGLTYGIHSYLDTRKHGSTFLISTSINLDKTKESIQDIYDISLEMSKSKLDPQEISRSVEFMTGSFARSLETPKQITGLIQILDSFDLDESFLTGFYSKIRLLTVDEIFDVQKKYFSDTDYMIAASGNPEFLKNELAEFGTSEIIDI